VLSGWVSPESNHGWFSYMTIDHSGAAQRQGNS
jgi:hypothetical protein